MLIHDGWNLQGTIHDGECPLRFLYRPMLKHERRQFQELFEGWDKEAAFDEIGGWLSKHIVAFGNLPSLADLFFSAPDLLRQLRKIVAGVAPSEEPNGLAKGWEQESRDDLEEVVIAAYRNVDFPQGPYTARNRLAWEHFKMCEAIGRFPDDLLVARNAAIIRPVMQEMRRAQRLEMGRLDANGRVGRRPAEPDPIWLPF